MKHLNHCLAALALATLCIPAAAQNDWQSRKDRENAATSASSITRNGGRFDSNAESARQQEAQRRAAQQPASSITHCDPGFCYDNKGGVYHKSGTEFLIAPNGKTCSRSGPSWVCP